MARAALGWSARNLAKSAQVSAATVDRFETGRANPIPSTLGAIQTTLESAGVEFIPGGVRLGEPAEAAQ